MSESQNTSGGAEEPQRVEAVPPQIPGAGQSPPVGYASPDTATMAHAADVEKNKVFAMLAYLGILWLVPLLAAKDSPYAKFHTNQGLLLFLGMTIVSMCLMMFVFIPFAICLVAPVIFALVIVNLVLTILGIVNALNGRMVRLPFFPKIEIIK